MNNGKFVTVIKRRWLFMKEQGLVCFGGFFCIMQCNKDRIIFNGNKDCLKIKSRLVFAALYLKDKTDDVVR